MSITVPKNLSELVIPISYPGRTALPGKVLPESSQASI